MIAPFAPDAIAVQLNVVPETLFGLLMEKAVGCPEQIEAVEGVTLSVGRCFIVNGNVFVIVCIWLPVHPEALIFTVAVS